MKTILERFRKRLLDVTSSNRTVFHSRLTKSLDLDWHAVDYFKGASKESVSGFILRSNPTISILPVYNARSEEGQQLSNTLQHLFTKLRYLSEERGVYDLSIGYMYLQGRWKDGTSVRAPLILQPVRLEENQGKWILTKTDSPQWNEALGIAAGYFHAIPLDLSDWISLLDETNELNTIVFKTNLYEQLTQQGIDVRFASDYFTDTLLPFTSQTTTDWQKQFGAGELWIQSHAVLSIYPTSGSVLDKDYRTWLDLEIQDEIESFWLSKTLPSTSGSSTFLPFHTDAFQDEVLQTVSGGASIVVQGPPGSGKSETIANLVASAMAKGKKVVVVSQKRAALDVLYHRLSSIQIDSHVALLQDIHSDRKKIYQTIASHIEQLDTYKMEDSQWSSIESERRFTVCSDIFSQYDKEVIQYKQALFDTSIAEFSAYELYLTLNKNNISELFSSSYIGYPKSVLHHSIAQLEALIPYQELLTEHSNWWKVRVYDPEAYADSFRRTKVAKELYDRVLHFVDTTNQYHIKVLGLFYQQWKQVSFKDCMPPSTCFVHHLQLKDVDSFCSYWYPIYEEYKMVQQRYSGMSPEELNALVLFLQQLESQQPWIRWVNAILEYKKYNYYKNIFLGLGYVWTSQDRNKAIVELTTAIECLNKIMSGATKWQLSELNWLTTLDQLQVLKNSYQYMLQFFYIDIEQTVISWRTSMELLEVDVSLLKQPAYFLTNYSVEQIGFALQEPNSIDPWEKWVAQHTADILSYTALELQLTKETKALMQKITGLGLLSKSNVEVAVHSIYYFWLQHLERIYPILKVVDSIKWNQRYTHWPKIYEERRHLSAQQVRQSIRLHTYQGNTYNRLQNRTSYRDLYHQVTKKRSVWPIRKLMSEYRDELFQLIPCWMMTPEMVSMSFPMTTCIDLVIFDEASQCYPEIALPIIFRAQQVVVVGDSKQMPPYDVYQIRTDEETEDSTLEESAESILDFCEKYLPSLLLKGHYRSQHLALIEFSNKHFYNSALMYIPPFTTKEDNPLSYIYLHTGRWAQQQNLVEADWIVSDVVKKIALGQHSIGVITFNYPQAIGIEKRLVETAQKLGLAIPESVFVKNLENVQGDERDYIYLSVGYAPNAIGILQRHFGSLNKSGGERRLNVAITRARKHMTVVTSILPHELNTEGLKNEGVVLLKEYLQYVYQASAMNWKSFQQHWKKNIPSISASAAYTSLYGTAEGNYPFIDLIEEKSTSDTTLWIDTDDALQRTSARHHFLYKCMEMQQKGWTYQHYRSKTFLK
ncbi:MAG: AAA domain-containing protein [Cytophagaceae bacterium]|nr:AAA domain-containing protein [Cytophagaceae bacterium]